MTENKNYTQRYARALGFYMGIYWIFKFILFPLGIKIPFLQLLFIALTLLVPFMGYYFVRLYRNKVMDCVISFRQAWVFTLLMYLFASLLVAVAHYIYFRYIDHGFIVSSYTKILESLTPDVSSGLEAYLQQMETVINTLGSMSAIQITIQLLYNNIFWGSIIAIPTALFVKRSPQTNKP